MIQISESSWYNKLAEEFSSDYYKKLSDFVDEEYANKEVFPLKTQIFAAFDSMPFDKVKVVILGQDPYHTPGFATGLCFSVPETKKIPKSLQNIYKELHSDVNFTIPQHGNISTWTQQGVFLLNSTLTVVANKAGSHQKKGWEKFTDKVIETLSNERENLVFLLWGNYAKQKAEIINSDKHLILTAAHPSPLSAFNGFFGCKHFSKTNTYLLQKGIPPIDWSIANRQKDLFFTEER